VIPSLPGFGFSGKPTAAGWDVTRIARAWIVLMKRLGYTRYVAQGWRLGKLYYGGHGSAGAARINRHLHQSAACVPGKFRRLSSPASRLLPASQLARSRRGISSSFFYTYGLGYSVEVTNRPQTLYGIDDSPVGLAAWMIDNDAKSGALIARAFGGQPEGLTRDDILENVTLYWLMTNRAVSSARIYRDNRHTFAAPKGVQLPTAVSVFPRQ
jgi:hypothetical protein